MFTEISLRGFQLPTHATNLKLQTAFKEPPQYCGIYVLILWGTVYCKCGKQESAGFSQKLIKSYEAKFLLINMLHNLSSYILLSDLAF